MKHSGLALMAAVAIGLAACDSSETGPSGTALTMALAENKDEIATILRGAGARE